MKKEDIESLLGRVQQKLSQSAVDSAIFDRLQSALREAISEQFLTFEDSLSLIDAEQGRLERLEAEPTKAKAESAPRAESRWFRHVADFLRSERDRLRSEA